MNDNPIIRFLVENEHISKWLNILLHVVVIILFYSFLLMNWSVFVLDVERNAEMVREKVPIIGYLAPLSLYKTPSETSYIWGVIVTFIILATWLLSTRVKITNKSVPRRAFSFWLNWLTFCLVLSFYVMRKIKEIGYDTVVSIHYTIDKQYQDMMHVGSLEIIGYMLMVLPIIVLFNYTTFLYGQYSEDERIKEWFRTYKFQRGWLGRFGEEGVNQQPDIQLARNAETNAPVVLQGESRQLGTLLIGPPGSGKTSIKIKTAYKTDLGHLQRTINAFPKYVKKYGYGTEKFQAAMSKHLIGTVIIEPAKDLCDDAYELAIDHGIPEEFIVYLDPSNPNTPGFNAMVGPVSQTVETITYVLEAVAETKDEFFKQAARAVLKHYVYLLKLTRGDNCTLLDLDDLYQDPRKVMDLVEELETTIPPQDEIAKMNQDDRIHWIIVEKIVRWFKNEGIRVVRDRDGVVEKYPIGHEHEGKAKVEDMQFEFTRQTRNLLSDITKNPYLARILYAENAVDLDRLFSKGGILLVNTEDGLLQKLSGVFGKLTLLCVQNAVFRRSGNEKTRPLVSFYADEFYDYMNEAFLSLTSKGRKYRFAPLVACQSLSQFGVRFGKDFTESMLGTIRNTIVYGGTSVYDTELLAKYMGKEEVEELQVRESFTPTNMQSPNYTVSHTVSRSEKDIASSDSIMFQEFRYSYIRLVDDKSPKRAIRAVGDFVDTSSADQWRKALNPEAINLFMEYWRKDEHLESNVLESDSEDIPNIQSQLEDLRKSEKDIQEATEEIQEQYNERFKPYSSRNEQKGNDKVENHSYVVTRYPKESFSQKEAKAIDTSSLKVEGKDNIPVEDASQEPPMTDSVINETEKEDTRNAAVSFSATFGTKTKERDNQEDSTPEQKDLSVKSFSEAFGTNKQSEKEYEKNEQTRKSDSIHLKEVELDNKAISFLEELKKSK